MSDIKIPLFHDNLLKLREVSPENLKKLCCLLMVSCRNALVLLVGKEGTNEFNEIISEDLFLALTQEIIISSHSKSLEGILKDCKEDLTNLTFVLHHNPLERKENEKL